MSTANQEKRRITISRAFFRWLLLIVVIGFLSSMTFTYFHQTNKSQVSAENLLRINVQDVRQDVIDASNENLLELTHRIAEEIDRGASTDPCGMESMMNRFDVAEINVIDANGIIISSTQPEFLNFNMGEGEQSAEFLTLLDGTKSEHVQRYRPTTPRFFANMPPLPWPGAALCRSGMTGNASSGILTST